MSVALDDLEIEILKILEQDARISYRRIADDLRISVGTVHNRIKKLKDKGILKGFLLHLDTLKLGYNLKFLIMLSINGKFIEEVLKEISNLSEITTIFQTTGEYSATVICRFKSLEEVQIFLNKINQIPNINKVVSHMILNTFKEDKYHLFSEK